MVKQVHKNKRPALLKHFWAFLLCMTGLFYGCSLALDWDPNGLRCASGQSSLCGESYSCLAGFCILDNSLAQGNSCLYDRQCESGLICPNFVCAKPCDNYYDASETTCDTDEYCAPIPKEDAEGNSDYVGACTATTDRCSNTDGTQQCCDEADVCCDNSQNCQTGNICVSIKSGAKACLTTCEFEMETSGGGQNNQINGIDCVLPGNYVAYCDYLGSPEKLICMEGPPDATFQGEGGSCDKVENPCQAGYLCHNSSCRAACDLTSSICTCCNVGREEVGVCAAATDNDCDNL
jgi:hypothetical protein